MRARFLFIALLAAHVHAGPASAQAQAPPPPPKIWTVAMGAGWAMTSGNSDTSNLNASYDIVYDPQRKNVVKSDGLFLRAKTEGELTANRLASTFAMNIIKKNDVAVLMSVVYKN